MFLRSSKIEPSTGDLRSSPCVQCNGTNGRLDVESDGAFHLDTIGANAHTCELDGRIAGGTASLEDGACLATFTTTGKTVVVATNDAPQY